VPMRRHLLFAAVLVVALCLALPPAVYALAGGATGGGGGGGGGFGGGGGGGGYHSYGGSGSGGSAGVFALILVGSFLLLFAAMWAVPASRAAMKRLWREKLRRRGRKVAEAATIANVEDRYWDPEDLKQRVHQCFAPIQKSWEDRRIEDSRPYVSEALYERHRMQLEGLEKQGRVNRIAKPQLHDVEVVRIYNVADDGEDRFVAYIACSARDWVEDVKTGKVVNGNKRARSQFEQYWSFARHPEYGWVLDEIQQRSEGDYHLKAKLVNEDTEEAPA
jgi:Tim44-like domain